MTYSEPTAYNKHYDVSISPFMTGQSVGNITIDSDQPNHGGDVSLPNGIYLKARSTNTGLVFFGSDSGVDSSDFELAAGETIPVQIQNLNELWFYSDTVGNQVCWIKA